jgi:hypothetical protein
LTEEKKKGRKNGKGRRTKRKTERIIRAGGGGGERKRHYRMLTSFVPKLLQDLTTKYGRDIAALDKSFVQSLSSREDSNSKVLV